MNQIDASAIRARSRGCCAVMAAGLTLLLAAAGATAQTRTLLAGDDPAQPSSFTLNFGGAGGVASGHIAFTDIGLEVDPAVGTARFVQYYQEVEPLTLPGGISTGNLIIEIMPGTSAGTYDAVTGEFNTEEFYAIHFDGDLSAFGLESPVILPSMSSGTVTLSTAPDGSINLEWEGDGQLQNPSDPATPLNFNYTCDVNATFVPTAPQLVELALTPQVVKLELPFGIERSLTRKLDNAAMAMDMGHARAAARMMSAFSKAVDAMAGRRIESIDADALITTADAIVDIMLADAGQSTDRIGGPKGRARR